MFEGSMADLRLTQLTEVTGLSPELIRAWERRYGFPTPVRTSGGHRRYSREQAEALHRAALLIRSGFRAREAITRAQQVPDAGVASDTPTRGTFDQSAEVLADSLIAGSPPQALALLRATQHTLGFERALEERVLPALRLVGDAWESGRMSVSEEHTATGIVISWFGSVRSELKPLPGPIKVLIATPPGEHHAVPVWALELLLSRRGIRALALGSDVPQESLVRELHSRRPVALALSISRADHLPGVRRAAIAAREAGVLVFAGGPGMAAGVAGVETLPPTFSSAADRLASQVREL